MRVAISGIAASRPARARFRSRIASSVCCCGSRGDALGIRKVENRIAAGAERDALIRRGQKAARPQSRAAARTARARLQHHEARQVLRLAADPVGDPGAHARPPEPRRAGVHETLRRAVIEVVRRDARRPARGRRRSLAMFGSSSDTHAPLLPCCLNSRLRAQQLRRFLGERVHEREALALPAANPGAVLPSYSCSLGL